MAAKRSVSWTVMWMSCLALSASASGAMVLPGMPSYQWYYGCSPTSAGMVVGYWDGRPGYGDLFGGDASVESQAVRDMIASPEHISDPYLRSHTANSIADFMKTSLSGVTDFGMIGAGLKAYIEWDDPNTPIDEGYQATVTTHNTPLMYGDLSWEMLVSEIDAGRPMMLNMIAAMNGDLYYHTIAAYGYQEDMFQISTFLDGQQVNVTVGGFAVRDTWPAGSEGSSWLDWNLGTVSSVIDEQNVEWWPWLTLGSYAPDVSHPDWFIYQGITVNVVPEPGSLGALLVCGLLVIPRLARRSRFRR
jgi:hypothetical protein